MLARNAAIRINWPMTIETRWLVYPDGEKQETDRMLNAASMVDLNGQPLVLPLESARIIAYRIYKIRKIEERGQIDVLQYLELIPVSELEDLVHDFY